MVERFNRTLKTMLRKHAACFGNQWDQYLSGVLWAYRNTPHDSTGEKPSFLLFGLDCRSPTEAALLPTHPLEPTDISDYQEELMLSLSAARDLAAKSIRQAQLKYKTQYDRKATQHKYRIGDWVLVRFPNEESGKQCKLSRPWHGPYRVLSSNDPDVTVVNVYFPKDNQIQVHQSRVNLAHQNSLQDIIGMGRPKRNPDTHKWVDQLLSREELPDQHDSEESTEHNNPVDPESSSEEESEDEPPASDESLTEDMHSIPITSGSDASTRAQSTRYGLRRKISPQHVIHSNARVELHEERGVM